MAPKNSGTIGALGAFPDPSSATGAPDAIPFTTNCTGSVGTPTPGSTAATFAENVTGSPNTDGFDPLTTTVDVADLPTLRDKSPDVAVV